jgi:predicted Zn-dependent protease with MMP-like domain
MTITITALCGADSAAQTGSFIMCADTLVSWSSEGVPVSGNLGGSKIYKMPNGFYAAVCDDISRASQIISYLYTQMEKFEPSNPQLIDLVKNALDDTSEYVRLWMRREVLADYGVSEDEFLHDATLANRHEIAGEIKNRAMSTQITIAGFKDTGAPILLFSDCIASQEQSAPGFFCAGGAGNFAALNWLNFRQQNCFMSIQRTFFHVREAKQFSEVCPVVGELNQTILLRHGKEPVNLSSVTPLVSRWFANMFPATTDVLEKPDTWNQLVAEYGIKD